MDILDFVQLLDGVKRHGDGYKARCPAHEDHNPSLSVKPGKDGRVLVKCFTGCALDDILSALHLEKQDLFPQPRPQQQKGTPTAIYNYIDAHGEVLYRKLRYGHGEGKTFRQQRPDGKGGWKNELGNVRRVLYNLPIVLEADAVWIVEGERDADTLNAAGLVATTASEGAGTKWRKEYFETLRGKHVMVIPDNDDKGRQHAYNIANGLIGIAESVKLLDLAAGDEPLYPNMPEKGDVTDFFLEWDRQADANGKEIAARLLQSYAEKATTYKAAKAPKKAGLSLVSASTLNSKNFSELFQPVEQLICEGLTILAGASKIGKSWIALLLAVAVAQGEAFWGRNTSKCRVLYFALEDGERRLQGRLRTLGIDNPPDNLFLATNVDMMGAGFEEQLNDWLAESETPALVIVDTFQKIRGISPKGVNAYQSDYEAVSQLKRIADRHHVAIVCIHHINKSKGHLDPFDRISGSTGIMGGADTTILITRDRDEDIAEVRFTGRDVFGEDFVIRFTDGRWDVENGSVDCYRREVAYEQEPIVQLFRCLMAENPDGGRWRYEGLKTKSLELLGYQPFIDGRDCARKLSDGLSEELRKRDGILVECGVETTGGKCVKLLQVKPITSFQTKMHDEEGSGLSGLSG